jgi:hypothetical protein
MGRKKYIVVVLANYSIIIGLTKVINARDFGRELTIVV